MADAVGLSLGPHALDLVQVAGGFARPRIVKIGHVTLAGPIPDGPEAAQALRDPLLTLLRETGVTASKIHLGLAIEVAMIRYFQMPKLPATDRPTAIRFEAKKYLPFKLDELVSDFRVAILKSDPQVMRVMYYAVKKDVVSRALDTCRAAGLAPVSVETGLTSLMRALRRSRQLDPGKTQVLLAVDGDTASIAVVRHELIYLARNVTVAPPAAGETAGGGGNVFAALLNEAVVSVDYYRRRFLGEPAVTNVIVSAEAASPQWLRELGDALELPVETAQVGQGIPGGDRLVGNTAIAFGLALRALDRPGAVNLLPGKSVPPAVPMARLVATEAAAAAAILALVYLVQVQPVRRLTAQVASRQPPNAALGLPGSELTLERLQALLAERQGRLDTLERFRDDRGAAAAVLAELAAGLPEDLWLRAVAYRAATAAAGTSPERRTSLTVAGAVHRPEGSAALDLVNAYVSALNNRPALARRAGSLAVTSVRRASVRAALEVTDFELSNQGAERPR